METIVAARRHEVRVLFLAGAAYVAGTAVSAAIAPESSLSPTTLAIISFLSLALVARYVPWSRLPYDVPLQRELPFVFLGAGLTLAIAFLLEGQATLYFYLTFIEGSLILARRRWRLVWSAGVPAAAFLAYLSYEGWPAAVQTTMQSLPVYLMLLVSADLLDRQESQRAQSERLLASLSEAHRRLEDYAAQAEMLAVTKERARLAREIHDTLGHSLTALDVQMELLMRLPESQREARLAAAQRARALVKDGLAELRRAVAALRPGALETFSLVDAISELVADFRQTSKMEVVWACEGDIATLPPALGVRLYRAAQEAMTNVIRHAAASRVKITLLFAPESITLTVADNGRGGEAVFGFGLRGLQERAESLGGEFRAGQVPEGGFALQMKLPR